jgi:hypothetical protein
MGKRIFDLPDEQLERMIAKAVETCDVHGLHFFTILSGIDAYMEKRRRQINKETKLEREDQ